MPETHSAHSKKSACENNKYITIIFYIELHFFEIFQTKMNYIKSKKIGIEKKKTGGLQIHQNWQTWICLPFQAASFL